jgi:hypothetical protein
MEQYGRLDQGVSKHTGPGCLMAMQMPGNHVPDPAILSAAAGIVLSQGGPVDESGDDSLLVRRLCGQAPGVPEHTCRDAIARAGKLSRNAYTVCDAFREKAYGSGDAGMAAAIRVLEEMSPGFSSSDYRQAFAAGLLWTSF